ncbi:CoA transferase [Denitratisoma sp. DHT3]|uniref:CaiB/BaiF CoA transferase family protein n=1 Tax=Denitratisoma sp. DHT3 TaxID=1981880 RepID=UPI00119842AC|nr:CaiB/BaiF CoA-transferase family protein [Denitratisoma sp. DHT3]QDX81990.1 CoA transferase [Denitratisoma sp. DHT3]
MKLGDVGNEEAMGFGKPLAGVRVLALEQMQSLPWATQLLARLGAEVVKVEQPGKGEPGRLAQPGVLDPQGRPLGATFLRNNLNKRSICIDFKHEDGRALLKRMLARYDVFCENFKPGTLAALGLDYPNLSADNPHLIYFSLSGFGQTRASPYKNWPAYAAVAEAMSGVYEHARLPNRPPIPNPVAGLGDTGAGMFGVIGVLAALRHRDRIGRGQHVDIAMFDAMLAMADYGMNVWSLGLRRNPDEELIQPGIHHTFRAQDGWFMLQVVREHQFASLAHLIGCESWLTDERLSTRLGWGRHIESLIRPSIEGWAATRTRMDVCQLMAVKGVPAGPCLFHGELVEDPHVRAHDALVEIPRPNGDGPPVLVAGNPIKMSAVSEGPESRMPWVGEHTVEILNTELGLDDNELARLHRNGVIG